MKYLIINPKLYRVQMSYTQAPSPERHHSDKGRENNYSSDAINNSPSTNQSKVPIDPSIASSTRRGPQNLSHGTHDRGQSISPLTTAGTSSSVTPTRARARPATSAKRKDNPAPRRWRKLEEVQRRVRTSIARQVGHEVDSEGVKEYFRAARERDAAEDRRRKALSPEARKREDVEDAGEIFRRHIEPQLHDLGFGPMQLVHYPLFLLQMAPNTHNEAKCRLSHCETHIKSGRYRIAVSPGDFSRTAFGKLSSPLNFCYAIPSFQADFETQKKADTS